MREKLLFTQDTAPAVHVLPYIDISAHSARWFQLQMTYRLIEFWSNQVQLSWCNAGFISARDSDVTCSTHTLSVTCNAKRNTDGNDFRLWMEREGCDGKALFVSDIYAESNLTRLIWKRMQNRFIHFLHIPCTLTDKKKQALLIQNPHFISWHTHFHSTSTYGPERWLIAHWSEVFTILMADARTISA